MFDHNMCIFIVHFFFNFQNFDQIYAMIEKVHLDDLDLYVVTFAGFVTSV